MTHPNTAGPTTIPWPREMVQEMAESGLEFLVGSELYDRLASLGPGRGWDSEAETWAGIPMDVARGLPPRAFLITRSGASVSYCRDIDDPKRTKLPDL